MSDLSVAHASPFTFRTGLILFAVAACLVCLGYTLYTQQVWEDSLITLRHSENLLRGEGLVYNPGQRVHGFTSPVQALLLALCSLLTGQTSYVATIWLYRVFSIAAFALSGVLLLKALYAAQPRWTPALWFFGIVYAFDVKSVAFATNGMETAFMLLLLSWEILLIQADSDRWLRRGLCWGAMMWTRPDSCLYIAALALAELIFGQARPRRATLASLAKSAGLCALVYAPWFLWAWSYYGSPVPHTVVAKANVEEGLAKQFSKTIDYLVPQTTVSAAQIFRPGYAGENVPWLPSAAWSRVLTGITKALGLFCLLYWLLPTGDRLGRAASFCFAALCLYFAYMTNWYPWYFPPATLFGFVAVVRAISLFSTTATQHALARRVCAHCTMGALIAGQIAVFGLYSLHARIQQEVIEDGNRAVIGRWLKEHADSSDTVFLEPLGYIGYFSGLRMMDFPGLVSPEVVRVRPGLESARVSAIMKLKPEWVVLRYLECEMLRTSSIAESFQSEYSVAEAFDVHQKIDEFKFRPGDMYLRYDGGFIVFRRNTTSPSTVPPALPPGS